jgi:hypothetical protein
MFFFGICLNQKHMTLVFEIQNQVKKGNNSISISAWLKIKLQVVQEQIDKVITGLGKESSQLRYEYFNSNMTYNVVYPFFKRNYDFCSISLHLL